MRNTYMMTTATTYTTTTTATTYTAAMTTATVQGNLIAVSIAHAFYPKALLQLY